MTKELKQRNPLSLIKGVVSARHRNEIEMAGYVNALGVLEKHFFVYEQRLRVMDAPQIFPDGEVLLDAAQQGLSQLQETVEALKSVDPKENPQEAVALVKGAEEGYRLLVQLQDVNAEKQREFEEAYHQLEEEEDFENLFEDG